MRSRPSASAPRCFGPLDPVYDRERRATVTRESIEAGPPSIWRYARSCRSRRPPSSALAPGLTPLVRAPRLAEELGVGELWLKLDTANPTHSFKDRVVAVAAAKAQELGLTTLACSSTGNLANAVAARAAAEGLEAAVFCPADLEPEKLIATAVYGATLYAVDGTLRRLQPADVELSFELDWGFVNVGLRSYYAEGSKTIALRDRRAARLASCPTSSSRRSRPARSTRSCTRASRELLELGLVDGEPPRLVGGQAEGCAPVATAFAERRAGQARAARTRSRARSRSAAPPTATSRSRPRARPDGAIHAVPEDEVGESMALLAEHDRRLRRDGRRRHARRARAGGRRGQVGADDRVVLLVTGDGLKTPGPVADRATAGRDRGRRRRAARASPGRRRLSQASLQKSLYFVAVARW